MILIKAPTAYDLIMIALTRMFASLITEPTFYIFAIPAVIVLGLAKGGFSGVGTAATPMLALYLPPLEAAALLLPILLTQDAISLYAFRREWDAWNLKVMLPGAALGMGAGWLFAAHVSDDMIRILIGVVALAFVANVWLRTEHMSHPSTIIGGVFWGAIAGFASFASRAEDHHTKCICFRSTSPRWCLSAFCCREFDEDCAWQQSPPSRVYP
jgi:Sulfite exporter TauE/SafE